MWLDIIQEKPLTDFLQNKRFRKFRKIHRKRLMLESLFNKVADRKAYNLIKKRLQHRCFPVNIEKFLRTA